MKTVTMLEFRKNAAGILKRVARGECLLLTHRGKAAARLEPLAAAAPVPAPDDPALDLERFAVPGPGGRLTSRGVDRLLYGQQ
jgi:antitoxin (DNA-binding transcriptional repressor) of toxin-antitoxin stability system